MLEATKTDKFFAEDVLQEVVASYVDRDVDGETAYENSADRGKFIAKNPLRVSLDALHLERLDRARINGAKVARKDGSINYKMNYKLRTDIIPALDVRWLSEKELHSYHQYQPYFPQFPKDQNTLFTTNNLNFIESLEELLKYDFQKFWCVLLFSPEAGAVLREFIADPVYWFDYDCLNQQETNIYATAVLRALHVYQRMLRFKESEAEYLLEDVGMNYLVSKQHLTTSIIIRLAMLYNTIDENLVKKVVKLYFVPRYKSIYTKELRETLLTIKTLLETVDHVVSEEATSSSSTLTVGGAEVRGKPAHFDAHWTQEMVAHVLECFFSLSSFLPLSDEATEIAIELEFPTLIPVVYENVFKELEDYMKDRAAVSDELRFNIQNYTVVARNAGVKSFDAIVSYCIKNIVETADRSKDQENFVEVYLQWLQNAVGYELFITDYNVHSEIALQIDQISSFYPNIEQFRVKYIKSSLEVMLTKQAEQESLETLQQKINSCKLSDLWSGIFHDVIVNDPPLHLDVAELERKVGEDNSNEEGVDDDREMEEGDEEVEEMIRSIMETLPHLGDGFILQCLEHYQFNVSDTLAAILDENLPPHLAEIPFDTPRIPEETEPEEKQPLIAHRGKREDYKDAMQLLDDKSAIKEIKDLIVINSMTKEESSDDEFDDRGRDDDLAPPDADDVEERVFRHIKGGAKNLPVSDSSEESDEETPARRPDGAFCEDPAVLRARREAQLQLKRKGGGGRGGRGAPDVVGKPKGQGQEKDVLHNRDKKNVNKSSRANHNRKKGAQWKRSRGMVS